MGGRSTPINNQSGSGGIYREGPVSGRVAREVEAISFRRRWACFLRSKNAL